MGLKEQVLSKASLLYGFTNHRVKVKGSITLLVTLGDGEHTTTEYVQFFIVDHPMAFNAIFGRLIMRTVKMVVTKFSIKIKFSTRTGIKFRRSDQRTTRKCHMLSVKQAREPLFNDDEERTIKISLVLLPEQKNTLVYYLKVNSNVFAWSAVDMLGIDPQVIVHRLNILLEAMPVKQEKRKFAPQVVEVVRQEVGKLLLAGFIKEVEYLDWVLNMVMVKKANGKWRMCIDFTNLNKACPKDSFHLPSVDHLVYASVGHRFMSFMDAFSSYNQILLDQSTR
ncbi:uncharacterized protein LOC105767264 [Gossypium raimondii]|uniref:uncharacterized protein LOC105767264 n=1 Tax=Gossypium raimondii TaxID=29730 RepID=UPI00063AF476|nr:uncharacterized protein LOC105767264 [Gossypium raimondii]